MSGIVQHLLTNPYFSAGFGLFGLGAAAAVSRKGLQLGLSAAHRRYVVSVELQSKDPAYQWFLHWMSKNVPHTQHLGVQTSFLRHPNGHLETKFFFVPSIGEHFFNYSDTWIKFERQREKTLLPGGGGGGGGGGEMFETVTLTLLGRNKQILFDLLKDAKELALSQEKGYTIIFTPKNYQWQPFGGARLHRPFGSVILEKDINERLYEDVKNFLDYPNWYLDRGIPYRRGYLLHGPPGCGKSSFIQALAGRLQYSICVLSLSDRRMTDDVLNELLVNAPERSIILLEDIDAAFSEEARRMDEDNKRNMNQYMNTVTFSGLLNALDGVTASEGRVLFMTTNHLNKLDPALIRPGRVDRIEYVGHASRQMIKQLYNRFYMESAVDFDEIIPHTVHVENKISMAAVQGIFLQHKDSPLEALKSLKSSFEHSSSHKNNE